MPSRAIRWIKLHLLTVVSGTVMLFTFVAKDVIRDNLADKLSTLRVTRSTMLVLEGIVAAREEAMDLGGRLDFPKQGYCRDDPDEISAKSDAAAELACLSNSNRVSGLIMDYVSNAAMSLSTWGTVSGQADLYKKKYNEGNNVIANLAILSTGVPANGSPPPTGITQTEKRLFKEAIDDVGETQVDAYKFSKVTRSELDREIEEAERWSTIASTVSDALFLLGWILIVGGKFAGVDSVVGGG